MLRPCSRWIALAALTWGPLALAAVPLSPDWMTADAAERVVHLKIIGSMNHINGTMNFNGYGNGDMTITIPYGWTVKIEFENGGFGALPHSLAVIDAAKRPKQQGGEPAFPGAMTVKLVAGMMPKETDSFEFEANKAGKFLLFCGVPSHGNNGMWNYLVISKKAKAPAVTVKKKSDA
jgi:sulfocyanin